MMHISINGRWTFGLKQYPSHALHYVYTALVNSRRTDTNSWHTVCNSRSAVMYIHTPTVTSVMHVYTCTTISSMRMRTLTCSAAVAITTILSGALQIERTPAAPHQPCSPVMHPQAVSTGELSSLPLQVVIYFSGWYLVLFYPALLASLIYKGVSDNVARCSATRPGMRLITHLTVYVHCVLYSR